MLLKKLIFSMTILGAGLTVLLSAAPASAQATRTWVSGVGDDVNPCSRTAPCKTFAGAISKTAADGEIDCLDPGGFGAVTINKSMTIDCHEVFGSSLVAATNAIIINSDNAAAPRVRLRNINFYGANAGVASGINGIKINGANTSTTAVFIEDCWIDDFTTRGISDERTGGGKLYVTNTTIQNTGGPAIGASGGPSQVSINNVRALNSGFGIAIGSNATAMIRNSTMAGNVNGGVETEGSSTTVVDNSVVSGNGIGFQVVAGTVRVSNTDVAFNTTGVQGTISSFTNNRFTGNGGGGTISPVGSATSDTGQQ